MANTICNHAWQETCRHSGRHLSALGLALILLTGCDTGFFGEASSDREPEVTAAPGSAATRQVERDVEAPEVFQVSDQGLWDGRPSLGGVWVAHADVDDPERVIIRNETNGKFVIGALFRRERSNPGPAIQVSSDASDELGMLAGAPAPLSVTALRREEVAEPEVEPAILAETDQGAETGAEAEALAAPEAIAAQTLDAPATVANATAEVLESTAPAQSSLSKPFIQIGIFSVEENANSTAMSLRQTGIISTVKKQTSKGKDFWRVIVGPSTTSADRAAVLEQVKELGFADAYFVAG